MNCNGCDGAGFGPVTIEWEDGSTTVDEFPCPTHWEGSEAQKREEAFLSSVMNSVMSMFPNDPRWEA